MSASHRVETDQLQLPGLSVRAQVDGVCGHEPVSGAGHLADPRVQKDNRAEHAGCGRPFSSLMIPGGIRIYGQIKHAKFGESLDLPDG
jgi:hypothetical protein